MYLPPEIIERCRTERGEIQLQRRGHHYELISNGTFLMATYNGASERLLVRAALDAVATPRSVLIGGLGVGFSLAEALADDRVKMVKVIEIEPKVIEWNQSYLAPFSNGGMTDDRTEVIHSDLLEWIPCEVRELACPLETKNPDYVYLAEQPIDRKRFTRETRHRNGKGYLV